MPIKIADGYVEVRARTDGLNQDIAATESSSAGVASSAGKGIGRKLATGIGAGVAALGIGKMLGESITGNIELSGVQANLQARLTGTTSKASAAAGKAAGKVFSDGYGESLDEVNDSIAGIQNNIGDLSTFSQSQIENMSTDALTLSSVYGVDVTESTRTAGIMMKNGLAKNADEAFDILSKGYATGLDASGEFLDSLNEYSEPLSQLGFTGSQAIGMFKNAIDAGSFSIDKAGDAINEFAIRSIDGSKTTIDAYNDLGLNADDMMQKIAKGGKGATDATHDVITRLAAMKDPVAQDAAGVSLFGSMWEDTGKKMVFALDPAKSKIDSVKGSTDKLNEANTSAASKIEKSKRGFDAWKNSLIQADGPLGGIITSVMAVGAPAITAGAGLITMGASMLPLVTNLGKMVLAERAWTIQSIASSVASRTWAGVQWLVNAAMTANPIGLIIVGVGLLIAAIVLLVTHWGQVTAFLRGAWAGFMSWISPALKAVGSWFSGLWRGILAVARVVWAAIVLSVTGPFRAMVATARAIGGAFKSWWSGLWSGVKATASSLWNSIKLYAVTSFRTLVSGVRAVGSGLSSWWSGLWSGVRAYFSGAWNGIHSIGTSFANFFRGLPGSIAGGFSGMFDGIVTSFRGAINTVIGWWNNLSFGLPAIKFGGKTIFDGVQFGTPDLGYLATGTNYWRGGPTVVGEQGPEILNLPRGSKVTPNGASERMMRDGGKGGDTHIHLETKTYVNENPVISARQSAREILRNLKG